jgi:hypothetical protein
MHRICRPASLRLFAVVLACLTAHGRGVAADGEERGPGIAVLDFDYVDTSGEERDQRSDHEAWLKEFMAALKRDLGAKGHFSLIDPDCKPDPCDFARRDQGELLEAASNAGAAFLVIGGIHKMSTLVQWARVEVIDARNGSIALDRLFTFRGDTDEAWRRAEAFISEEISRLRSPE